MYCLIHVKTLIVHCVQSSDLLQSPCSRADAFLEGGGGYTRKRRRLKDE